MAVAKSWPLRALKTIYKSQQWLRYLELDCDRVMSSKLLAVSMFGYSATLVDIRAWEI
jgi:hypothetical protein